MDTDDNNRNAVFSRIIADLSAKSAAGEELSSKIPHLRDEIKKMVERENTLFGKFRALMESFREIIPEEKQRYHAALKALSTTSKVSRNEIVNAVNNQFDELKQLEKGILPALPGWRDELKTMEAKSQEMRDKIAKLREETGQLERQEKEVVNGMAARKREMEAVEKAVEDLFKNIGAEIISIKNKVEEYTAESAAPQPTPPIEKKAGQEQASNNPAAQDAQWEKKCPMCGGRMDFYRNEEVWQCYACAYEEAKKEGSG